MTQIPSDDRTACSLLESSGTQSLHSLVLVCLRHLMVLHPAQHTQRYHTPVLLFPQARNSKPVHLGWQMTARDSLHLKEKCENFKSQQYFQQQHGSSPVKDETPQGKERDSETSQAMPQRASYQCVSSNRKAHQKKVHENLSKSLKCTGRSFKGSTLI